MNEKSIKNIENKLQVAVTLALFFPVVMEALFTLAGMDSKEISAGILKSGLIIFLLISNYLLFEWRKDKLSIGFLKFISWITVLIIICFAILFLFFGFLANGNIEYLSWLKKYLYLTALIGIMALPVLNIILMLTQIPYAFFRNKKYSL